MNRFLPVLIVSILLGAQGGCRTPSAGITVESYPKTQIQVNSKVVGQRLNIVEYNAREKNGLLQVQITAQNTTQKDCQFEYRFEWHDADGMIVTTPMTTWVPVSVSAMEKVFMKGIAPSKNAEDFVFIVRFSRPSMRW